MLTLTLLIVSQATLAEETTKLYVTDQMRVTLRSGASNEFRVKKILTSGTQVTPLEKPQGDYMHIKTATGIEGWILKRYLVETPTAAINLIAAHNRISALKQTIRALENQALVTNPMDIVASPENRVNAIEIQHINANKIDLYEENNTLKIQLLGLRHELQSQQQENANSKDRANREWFLVGVVVWITGMVLGFRLPSLQSRKKQQPWNTL